MFVKCRMCRGKGSLFTAGVGMGSTCPTCKGKRGFEIPEGKTLCPRCDGKKTIPMRICEGLSFEITCDKCFGDGFVDK